MQLSPLGQHIADLLSLKAIHCWFDGQQKFEGRPALLHGFCPDAHWPLARLKREKAWLALSAWLRAVVDGIAVLRRQTVASLSNPMIAAAVSDQYRLDVEAKLEGLERKKTQPRRSGVGQ